MEFTTEIEEKKTVAMLRLNLVTSIQSSQDGSVTIWKPP